MTRKHLTITTLALVAAAALIITSAMPAAAGPGYGRRGQGQGMGWNQDWNGCPGYGQGGGAWNQLTDEQMEQVKTERAAFFEATKDLRQGMRQKRLELQAEIAKKTPDAEKAAELQQELSKLQAEFDLKRLDHRLRMKQIDPDLGMGMGFGRGHGHGRGGRFGGGNRW